MLNFLYPGGVAVLKRMVDVRLYVFVAYLVVCVHAVCAGYEILALDPPVEVDLSPVQDGCVQTMYLTTKGEFYGMEFDVSDCWAIATYGNASSRLMVERGYREFFQDAATNGRVLKPGCQHPTAEDWMQVQTPWAFEGRYDLCAFYSSELKGVLQSLYTPHFCKKSLLRDFSVISESVAAHICSRYRVMLWSMVGEDFLEQAVNTRKRTRNELFVRVPEVGIFYGVQQSFSLLRGFSEQALPPSRSALKQIYTAMGEAAKSHTKEHPYEVVRYSGNSVTKLYFA